MVLLLAAQLAQPSTSMVLHAADVRVVPAQSPFPISQFPIPIPMRDGTTLRATVLRPSETGRFPTLVYRTPYGQETAVKSYSMFTTAVRRGYAVVAVDVRGRYGSDGEFDPYRQEGRDGYDTIEWAAAQPWSNGRVGTFGLSYPGAVQWLAAVESPPHLVAMAPAMTFSRPTNFWYSGGLPDLSWISWIWLNIAPDVRRRRNLSGPRTADEARASWELVKNDLLGRLPLTNVPELREIAPWYFEWLDHPPDDPWWSWADLTDKYGRIRAAALNLSGWHDEAYGPEGAITNHAGLQQQKASSYLVIGPWVHGIAGINDSTAHSRSGERVFGAKAGFDYDDLVLRYMDHHLKGLDNGFDREARVRVFVMGENRWRTADRWPLPGTRRTDLFLAGPAGRRTDRGRLDRREPSAPASLSLHSDPAGPVLDSHAGRAGAHDYRALGEPIEGRDRPASTVLVFETEPLDADLRIIGEVGLELWIRTDAPDVDLWAKLLDVEPDGTAWNLMSPGLDVVRASYRNGRRALLDGKPTRLTFPDLRTGNLFRRGHRIRLVILPSFMPNFSRNLQTGMLETRGRESRPATITILTGPSRSRLTLPVVPD
jgi:putative CocE/NonD family hydrolase